MPAGPKMRNGTRQQMPMEIGSLVSFVTYVRRAAVVRFIMFLLHAYVSSRLRNVVAISGIFRLCLLDGKQFNVTLVLS